MLDRLTVRNIAKLHLNYLNRRPIAYKLTFPFDNKCDFNVLILQTYHILSKSKSLDRFHNTNITKT